MKNTSPAADSAIRLYLNIGTPESPAWLEIVDAIEPELDFSGWPEPRPVLMFSYRNKHYVRGICFEILRKVSRSGACIEFAVSRGYISEPQGEMFRGTFEITFRNEKCPGSSRRTCKFIATLATKDQNRIPVEPQWIAA